MYLRYVTFTVYSSLYSVVYSCNVLRLQNFLFKNYYTLLIT